MAKNYLRKISYIVIGLLASIVVIFNNIGCQSLPEQPDLFRSVSKQASTTSNSTYLNNVNTSSKLKASVNSITKALFFPAIVTRIIDGDTIEVRLNGKTEKVRFIGVDTPETKHPDKPVQAYGLEAASFTKKQLAGKKIFLEKDVSTRDRYGRLLAYVWLTNPANFTEAQMRTNMFNARLLLSGYAQIMTIPPDIKYVDYFTRFQTEARQSNKGLWSTSLSVDGTGVAKTNRSDAFWGSSQSRKYHYSKCAWAAKITPSNLLTFSSPVEARNAGFIPCKVCLPQ
jgi:micrococcal nuclease